ncbi:MAG: Obg family GTPase CgtA [Candidatus Roizmanbacteria bacterium GW2011_GWA2_37_7]|uniref:Obg family GTPase CgtA n=1 Tax=Candidatus Roizmanbacteria bacterium GW2011_GWA2_37_7 TaxID=1618481 RepID=A0A0G0HEG3_9BACT|nr:MAG: Obg family GTPase CgtA [Candidatus Roizmanbacteria bacterium GW2011_GWA2_37_7]
MFIDEAQIYVQGGNGGSGSVAFFPMKKGPCGGHGGKGGDVIVQGDPQMSDLHMYMGAKLFKAQDGGRGEKFCRTGSNGAAFVSSTNQVPRQAEPGEKTQKKCFRLVLKLIADFGLIGLPNAGKSTLLNELTNANVKTAMYAFTTLEPNLGVCGDKIIADIPGLIEGASKGKGLGIKFLKHIEKVPVLLHCIAADSENVKKNYETVQKELEDYNTELTKKKEVILLCKTDLVDQKKLKKLEEELKQYKKELYPISIYNPDQFLNIKNFILS